MRYTLAEIKDSDGNVIECGLQNNNSVEVYFRGKNNKLIVHPEAKIDTSSFHFDCDNAICIIGKNEFRGFVRLGLEAKVEIKDGVTCTSKCYITAAEMSVVLIGEDCMIATSNEFRADDGHPIFDVETGKRINLPTGITIGNHVWIGAKATILGGTDIGEGSVVGYGSIVKGVFPNNCVLAGAPARLIKKDIAWERPHLTLTKPAYKPDASSIVKSKYWNKTRE
ncbi:acyltransferase [Atlantibacter hermannii]|uniref:acyltransferase n=1 Tax=Atlantibacter hermannii TaxID=565 RepID=UPI0009B97CC1|nr:acyltransferase [Atlantibacter hermannii]MDU1953155.1 acyltransferase [Atlantibacter hermannii]